MKLEEYNNLISQDGIVIVKFSGEWCAPCKSLEKVLDKISEKEPDIKFVKLDVDDEPELCENFGIRNVPVLMYYKDGEAKDMTVGMLPEQTIIDKINAIR